ncbi:MAG: hypothetical protein D8M59_05895 [Planctomycetes bacterium]|nr:hypothetical protein [Planctomycetota bacterium]NOG55885.1 hypothetical protein [Planctomycetota bacterium]
MMLDTAKTRLTDDGHHPWPDLDLELYHDGQLDSDRERELAEALRHDPDLRCRLARIVKADAVVRDSLLTEETAEDDMHDRRWPIPFDIRSPWGSMIAVAALLSIIVTVTAVVLTYKSQPGTTTDSSEVNGTRTARTTDTPPVPFIADGTEGAGVVMVVPYKRPRSKERTANGTAARHLRPAATSETRDESTVGQPRLATALARGDVEPVLRQIEDANTTQAVERVYREIGLALRSSMTAEIVLNRMSQPQQVEACRLWAADVSLRPVVFDRLRTLASSGNATLSEQVGAIVADLDASEPTEYRKWINSYGLASLLATWTQQQQQQRPQQPQPEETTGFAPPTLTPRSAEA